MQNQSVKKKKCSRLSRHLEFLKNNGGFIVNDPQNTSIAIFIEINTFLRTEGAATFAFILVFENLTGFVISGPVKVLVVLKRQTEELSILATKIKNESIVGE